MLAMMDRSNEPNQSFGERGPSKQPLNVLDNTCATFVNFSRRILSEVAQNYYSGKFFRQMTISCGRVPNKLRFSKDEGFQNLALYPNFDAIFEINYVLLRRKQRFKNFAPKQYFGISSLAKWHIFISFSIR